MGGPLLVTVSSLISTFLTRLDWVGDVELDGEENLLQDGVRAVGAGVLATAWNGN